MTFVFCSAHVRRTMWEYGQFTITYTLQWRVYTSIYSYCHCACPLYTLISSVLFVLQSCFCFSYSVPRVTDQSHIQLRNAKVAASLNKRYSNSNLEISFTYALSSVFNSFPPIHVKPTYAVEQQWIILKSRLIIF